jgi:hypothetical protein
MNPTRTCPICTGVDDHPRHVITLPDGTEMALHMDCCASARNCEVCTAQLAGVGGVEGNPKGEKLRAHLKTTGPAPDQAGWTAPITEEV